MDQWNKDYLDGRWEYLRALKEQARFDVVAGYVHRYGAGKVLDVGCGVGQVLARLDPGIVTSYTGIDLSDRALSQLPDRGMEVIRVCADTVDALSNDALLSSELRFQAIVLSEILYYLEDPASILDRLAGRLSPQGCLIVSMATPRPDQDYWLNIIGPIWAELDGSGWDILDEVTISHISDDLTWRVRAFCPAQPNSPS